jgi:hypothetical protein
LVAFYLFSISDQIIVLKTTAYSFCLGPRNLILQGTVLTFLEIISRLVQGTLLHLWYHSGQKKELVSPRNILRSLKKLQSPMSKITVNKCSTCKSRSKSKRVKCMPRGPGRPWDFTTGWFIGSVQTTYKSLMLNGLAKG